MSGLELFSDGEFELDIALHDMDGFHVRAPGLARALGFREAYDLVRNIPDPEKGSELVRTPGGDQRIHYLTEAGFYRALGQRQLGRIPDEAIRGMVERFQAWVFGTVLPGLRRGTLVPAQRNASTLDRRALALMVIEAEDAREAAEAKVAELEPKAAIADTFLDATGDYSVREAAQILARDHSIDLGQTRLFARLRQVGWLDPAGRPYQRHVDCGRLVSRAQTYGHPRTGDRVVAKPQVRITPKGLADLYRLLAPGAGLALLASMEDDQ